jgi:hypothetical protein
MLRMLVTSKDGSSAFHDLVVDPSLLATPELTLTVSTDGTASFEARTFDVEDAAELGALTKLLSDHADQPGFRHPDGVARCALVIRARPETRWQVIRHVLQAAAEARIEEIRYGRHGDFARPISQPMPRDEGLTADHASRPQPLVVEFAVDEDAGRAGYLVVVRSTPALGRLEGAHVVRWQGDRDAYRADLLEAIATVRGDASVAVIATARPDPYDVRYDDVLFVLETLRSAGMDDVRFDR